MARPAREREHPAPTTPSPELQTAVLEPVMFTHEPVAVEPPPTIAPATLPQEPYLPETNTGEQQPEPEATAPARQPWKMEPVALPPDMMMIETQADKAARMLEGERQDVPRPARAPRQRKPEPVIPDEPLQQVETRKE